MEDELDAEEDCRRKRSRGGRGGGEGGVGEGGVGLEPVAENICREEETQKG